MGKSRLGESSRPEPDSDKEPSSAAGWVGLGNKLKPSDPDRALAAFRRAVLMDPKSLAAWLSIAELCLAGGEKRCAEDAAREAMALQPTGAEESERLCVLLLLLGREVDAERLGKRLLALNPEDKRSWSKLRSDLRARALYRPPLPAVATGASVDGIPEQGQKQEARIPGVTAEAQRQSWGAKQYTPSRESAIDTTMPSQALAAGRAALLTSQTEKPPASSPYEAAPQAAAAPDQKPLVTQTPTRPQGEAEMTLRRLVEENPDSINAVKGLARSLHADGKLVETIQVAEKGLVLKPDDPELLYLLGSSALDMGDFGKARQTLQRCTVVSPRSIEAWTDLGCCHIAEGNANDGARALLSAIRIDPNNAKALVYFATTLMMQNQNERAVSVLMKVLEIEKASPALLERAAELLDQLGQTAAARRARTRAAALKPQNR